MDSSKPSVLTSATARAWLKQFRPADQDRAVELLSKFRLVSRDEFADGLRALILRRAEAVDGRVALFAEREIRKWKGVPNRLFKEARRRVRRASGAGPTPIQPTKAYDPAVGSEGLVSQLITELCRADPKKFLNHPGPDKIRKKQVRAFYIVTDLLASGRRSNTYLNAAWRVRSVRSWWSGHFLRFEVISFAATAEGRKLVGAHRCKPFVSAVIPCPTIQSCFDRADAGRMVALCVAYDPIGDGSTESLGFGGIGTLIAFAHGVPNNAPRIFYKKSSSWTPLFPARITADMATRHFGRDLSPARIVKRLEKLNQQVLARSPAVTQANDETKMVFLLLAALARPPRRSDVVAERTGLTILEIDELCGKLVERGWLGSDRRLTDAGRGELARANKSGRRTSTRVVMRDVAPYYPRSLRPPAS